MRCHRVLAAAAGQVWLVEQTKGRAIAEFLARVATDEEIETRRISPRKEEALRKDERGVAIIEAHGVFGQRMNVMSEISGGTSTEMLEAEVRGAIADPAVKAIMLHIDSPGGSVYGLQSLAATISEAKRSKPIVAQVDSLAASAAYWIASQCTEIVASPGSDVGSIGAYMLHEDVSEMLEAEGVKETLIYSGKYKVEGNPYEPLNDDAREFMQSRVDLVMRDFLAAVAEGRGKTVERVAEKFGQGRCVEAREALKAGMIDGIATPRETLSRFYSSPSRGARAELNLEKEKRRIALLKSK